MKKLSLEIKLLARIDDYHKAVELGREALRGKDPQKVAEMSGAGFKKEKNGKDVLTLLFLNEEITISWPGLEFHYVKDGSEVPIQQQVLLLHYLDFSGFVNVSDEWIAYQEIPDGKFYLDAFIRRAKNPMVSGFGHQTRRLLELTEAVYGGTAIEQGDVGIRIQALPKIPVALILYEGDDEFPPDGTILFDRSISRILSAEDVAWLAGMIIYPLLGMAAKSK